MNIEPAAFPTRMQTPKIGPGILNPEFYRAVQLNRGSIRSQLKGLKKR
jgi:hypothetical protein